MTEMAPRVMSASTRPAAALAPPTVRDPLEIVNPPAGATYLIDPTLRREFHAAAARPRGITQHDRMAGRRPGRRVVVVGDRADVAAHSWCPQDHRQGRARARGGEFSCGEVEPRIARTTRGVVRCHPTIPLPTSSFTSFAATRAVRSRTSWSGLYSTRSAPTMRAGRRWMSDTTSRVDKPPGSGCDTRSESRVNSVEIDRDIHGRLDRLERGFGPPAHVIDLCAEFRRLLALMARCCPDPIRTSRSASPSSMIRANGHACE